MTMEGTNNNTALEISEKHIDLERLLAKKDIKLPKFVIRYFHRLLHLDEVNDTIYSYRDKIGLDFLNLLYKNVIKHV